MIRAVFSVFLALTTTVCHAEAIDSRQVLHLDGFQREHVLGEMRALLSGTERMLDALSRDDMGVFAQQARGLGMAMAHKAENHLKGVLPPVFMQLGMALHQDFDRIAADAQSVKDPKRSLGQLSATMGKCAACHASYQIQTERN